MDMMKLIDKERAQYARQNTRRLLWQWGTWRKTVDRLERELKSARIWMDDARETLKAQHLDGMPHGSGNKRDISDVIELLEKRQDAYTDLVARIQKEIDDVIRLRNTINDIVAELSPLQRDILVNRYCDGHGWHYISIKMERYESFLRRKESAAVDYIARKIKIEPMA